MEISITTDLAKSHSNHTFENTKLKTHV